MSCFPSPNSLLNGVGSNLPTSVSLPPQFPIGPTREMFTQPPLVSHYIEPLREDSISSSETMAQMSYTRLRRRWRRMRGFRLNCSRLSVLRLRVKFLDFFRMLTQCLGSLKKGARSGDRSRCGRSTSRRGLVSEGRHATPPESKLRSCTRSNSFYAEAIADCLEFIRRTSVSVDGNTAPGR